MDRSISKFVMVGLAAAATACSDGSGSGTSNNTPAEPGATAQLALMDAPPEGVTAVKVTVASMQVHVVPSTVVTDAGLPDAGDDLSDAGEDLSDAGDDTLPPEETADAGTIEDNDAGEAPEVEADDDSDGEGGWVTLDVNQTIDLVQHQGEDAAVILGQLPLPQGKITQIRLVIDTSLPENNVATYNGEDCNLGVQRVAKKGVKINHVFKAFDSKKGSTVQMWVDFDLEKSMKPNKNGCFDLEPKLSLKHAKMDGKDVELE